MNDDRPLLCLFSKVRQEIVRENNIVRMLANAEAIGVDAAVILDDGSTDGTADVVSGWIMRHKPAMLTHYPAPGPGVTAIGDDAAIRWHGLLLDEHHPERAFGKELLWKQRMIEVVHTIRPHFVLWMDADEVFDRAGTALLRQFCELRRDDAPEVLDADVPAWTFHYTQLWRASTWARTDEGFDDGWFWKLWRWTPELSFQRPDEAGQWRGLHQPQFPVQVLDAINDGRTRRAPFEQIHYGNFGKSLAWKCIQYARGFGGVGRHLHFTRGVFRPVDPCSLPEGAEHAPVLPLDHHTHGKPEAGPELSLAMFMPSRPRPFSSDEVVTIEALGNLHQEPDTFTVVVPTFNRATYLDRTLTSLLDQRYPKWVALVLDDGSTDDTPALMRHWQDRDPRIFYCRYPVNRGGVAMNEIGMRMACEWTSWWTRLGSDDWFGPEKLMYDAKALANYDACYGAYQVNRDEALAEVCNGPLPAVKIREALLGSRFMVSWANCAVRTSVLRDLRQRYGHFCDPRLRNMEDFLVNARIARHSRGWVWRGPLSDSFVIDPTPATCAAVMEQMTRQRGPGELEAIWTCVTTGASGDGLQTAKDENLTRALITRDMLAEKGLAS